MAQGEKKFSHISVSSDEDDEFVIEAGRPAASRFGEGSVSEGFEGRADSRALGEESSPARLQPAGAADARKGGAAGEPCVDDEPSPHAGSAHGSAADAKPGARSAAAGKAAGAKNDYQPTTLEDLEGASMSMMQKVIIGLALAGIVAAVVYYIAVLA